MMVAINMDVQYTANTTIDNLNSVIWERVHVDYKKKFPEEEYLEEIINIDINELFTPQIITTISASGKIEGVRFSEHTFVDMIRADKYIFVVRSNFGGDYLEGDPKAQAIWNKKIKMIEKNNLKTKQAIENGRKVRKRAGEGANLNSQIGFYIRRHPDDEKNVFVSLFKNGVFNITGLKDHTLSDGYIFIYNIIRKLAPLLQTKPYVSRLFPTYYKYIFQINYPLCVPLVRLYKQLSVEKEDTDNGVDIYNVEYDQEKDPAKLTLIISKIDGVDVEYPVTNTKKEKHVHISCFQNRKVNIGGYVPENLARAVYQWLKFVYYKVLVTDVEHQFKDKYKII